MRNQPFEGLCAICGRRLGFMRRWLRMVICRRRACRHEFDRIF